MTASAIPVIRLALDDGSKGRLVRVGIPFPKGWLIDPSLLSCRLQHAEDSIVIPAQYRVLARWPDRSVKWLLTDICASFEATPAQAGDPLSLTFSREGQFSADRIAVTDTDGRISVDTGAATFEFLPGSTALISQVTLPDGVSMVKGGVRLLLKTSTGAALETRIDSLAVDRTGPVSTEVLIQGGFVGDCPLEFKVVCTLMKGSSAAVLDVRLRNPRAALHRGGTWDLGDPGSFLIGEASLVMQPQFPVRSVCRRITARAPIERGNEERWAILQDSSGGVRWDSPNHLEADGRLGVSFRGFSVISVDQSAATGGGEVRYPGRSQPTLGVLGKKAACAVSIRDFWQNFPKSIQWDKGELRACLFPSGRRCATELQGGEQKRHRVSIVFGRDESVLDGAHDVLEPLHAWIEPEWVEASGAVRGFVADLSTSSAWMDHVRTIVDGPEGFVDRREVIDEYGWRNFGDLYADHESVNHKGSEPFVTHYNNQYDFVWAAGLHAMRTGDARWDRLARECAEHTVDIDVYHTKRDRAAFSGGFFWHTDHYLPALTCTHRTYSIANSAGQAYGGGPSNEHNYASGLLLHYWRTGDDDAREAVIGAADWVIAMDDGSKSLLGLLDNGPTGHASKTVDAWYHGPGRGAGNSLASLMDAYLVERRRLYLDFCESLIRRCIHPKEDIALRGLEDIENRWSYLAFLQSLGRYLELKLELGEIDFMFQYARESLLLYADWMLEHEVPYKDVLDRVELPTESWSAQDIRKCHVMHLAARFDARGKSPIYTARACFFHDRCLADLNTFSTRHLTRPLVLLAVYGHLHAYYTRLPPIPDELRLNWDHDHQFGDPERFQLPRERLASTLRNRSQTLWREVRRLAADRLASRRRGRSRAA